MIWLDSDGLIFGNLNSNGAKHRFFFPQVLHRRVCLNCPQRYVRVAFEGELSSDMVDC